MILSDDTIKAIRADEFARKALEAIKGLIYAQHRDWNSIDRKGRIIFDDDKWGISYSAICEMLGDYSEPDVDGTVMIGGMAMKASHIQELANAFRK